ncbi:response regulator [bacterium]|nr:response regulator [bacterium]
MRVLIIEDYEPVRSSLAQALSEDGFTVDAAADGTNGLWLARHYHFDAIVLDIMLPGIDGMEILRMLRQQKSSVPVLLLTARHTVEDRVEGLDSGADDYLVKPFAMAELLARVRAMIRRRFGDSDSLIQIGELSIDTTAKSAQVGEETLELTAGEYRLLELLCRRRNQVVTRSEIWDSLYDTNSGTASNVVDVYIGYLRKKLKSAGMDSLIETRRGLGYLVKDY